MSNTTDWGSMIANIVMATTAVWAAFKANDWFKTKRLESAENFYKEVHNLINVTIQLSNTLRIQEEYLIVSMGCIRQYLNLKTSHCNGRLNRTLTKSSLN